MPSLDRLFHGSLVRKGAQNISRKYKKFIISWHDKIHKSKDGNKIMEEFVDEHGEMLKEQGVIEIIARGPKHPPRPGEPETAKERVTAYGLDVEGRKKQDLHLNADGTYEMRPVPLHKQ